MVVVKESIGNKPLKYYIANQPPVTTSGHVYKLKKSKSAMEMKTIKFNVEECDGYFVADAVDHAIVTQGKTWSSLMKNIDEAVRLHFNLKNKDKYSLVLDIKSDALSLVKKGVKS
jgi:predicted RNase H-like HicB family nuclease